MSTITQQAPPISTLALDTSSPRESVALMQGREVAAELRLHSQETHSARLLNSIRYLLSCSGWDLEKIELIAVGIGPGSFTGVRIGVATALGLAQSLSRPLACVSGLDALAFDMAYLKSRIGIVIDAQRMQVYYAEYIVGPNGRVRLQGKPSLWFPGDLDQALGRRRLYLAGDGAVRYRGQLRITRSGFRRLIERDLFLAPSIARVALARKRTWRKGDYVTTEPLYIRLPDALRKKQRIL